MSRFVLIGLILDLFFEATYSPEMEQILNSNNIPDKKLEINIIICDF